MRIALATCADLPEGRGDEPLRDSLGAEWAIWDDPSVDWDAYDLVVVRSVWDYVGRRDELLAWARSVPRLVNPAEVLAWNTDKTYLREVAAAGLPTVPTTFVAPGEAAVWPQGDADWVVKPTESAGARGTGRFAAGDVAGAGALLAVLHAEGRTAMVQPYLDSVDRRGETALLTFGGAVSHVITKAQILEVGAAIIEEGGYLPPVAARQATAAESAVAARVLHWLAERFGRPLAYARIDLVEDERGEPIVLELELTEPFLFWDLAPDGAERFAAVLRERAASARGS